MLQTLKMLLPLALCCASCSAIYVEQPVPQAGQELHKIPDDWSGVFQWETSSGEEEFGGFVKNFLRLERLDDKHLLISAENRMLKSNLPNLNLYLNEQASEGQHIDYQLKGQFIFYQLKSKQGELLENHVAHIQEQGDWIVFTHSSKPFMLLDLSTKTATEYSADKAPANGLMLFPVADSLETEVKPLVLRQKGKVVYLNIQENSANKWAVTTITSPAKGKLALTLNTLRDRKDFEARLDYFNGITPFKPEGDSYLVKPSDEAFDRLLLEPIFETWSLTKINDPG